MVKVIKTSSQTYDYPIVRQANEYSCGVAAVQSVLFYAGKDIRYEDLQKDLKTTEKDGTAYQEMVRVFADHGITAEALPNQTTDGLKLRLKDGYLALLVIQAYKDPNGKDYTEEWNAGHWVVAIGYNDKVFVFMDPSSPQLDYIHEKELDTRWHDIDGRDKVVDHFALYMKVERKWTAQAPVEKME